VPAIRPAGERRSVLHAFHRTGCSPFVLAVLVASLGLAAGCARSSDHTIAEAAEGVLRTLDPPLVGPETPPAKAESPAASDKPLPPAEAQGEVRLTLAEAISRALANNPDIQFAGFAQPLAHQDVISAEAIFDPALFMTNTVGRVDRPVQGALDTGSQIGKLIQNTWSFQGGLKQKVPTGGSFAVYQAWDYQQGNSIYLQPNPQYATRLAFEFSQPLLRGGGVEYNRAPIRVANLNEAVSTQDFRKAVTDIVASLVSAYWQLAFDLESVRVSQASLNLAAEVLRREKGRQALGVSAEIDLSRATAAVALRQADVYRAENQARDSMDRLKAFMNAPDIPLTGDARILPVEAPRHYVVTIDRRAAVASALANRPELERGRNAAAINRIRADVAGADRLPKLDATLKYVMNGLGKTFKEGVEQQDWRELITWSAGFEFELPIGNHAAVALYHRRQMEYDQSLVDLDRQTIQATQEVNSAVRAILLSRQEVEATLEATTAAARTVRGEQLRFELGQTTNDELLRAQETLSTAQRDHLKALLNFNLGLISLARAEGVLLESQGIEAFQPESTTDHPRPMGLQLAPSRRPTLPAGMTVTPTAPGSAGEGRPANEKRK
jgi:outer membrane protein